MTEDPHEMPPILTDEEFCQRQVEKIRRMPEELRSETLGWLRNSNNKLARRVVEIYYIPPDESFED